MKSYLEQQFEKSMITHICLSEATPEEKARLLTEFHHNSEAYYDTLCAVLLAVSTNQEVKPIWITPSGESYLSMHMKNKADRILIFPDEVPQFEIDLVEQLEIALLKI